MKKVLCLVLAILCLCGCSTNNTDYSQSSNSNYSEKKAYSLAERKELAEIAFIRKAYDKARSIDTGRFAPVYWGNTRYSISVSQQSENYYVVTAIFYLYDMYDNYLGTASNVYGSVRMTSDGTVEKVEVYGYVDVEWD